MIFKILFHIFAFLQLLSVFETEDIGSYCPLGYSERFWAKMTSKIWTCGKVTFVSTSSATLLKVILLNCCWTRKPIVAFTIFHKQAFVSLQQNELNNWKKYEIMVFRNDWNYLFLERYLTDSLYIGRWISSPNKVLNIIVG